MSDSRWFQKTSHVESSADGKRGCSALGPDGGGVGRVRCFVHCVGTVVRVARVGSMCVRQDERECVDVRLESTRG